MGRVLPLAKLCPTTGIVSAGHCSKGFGNSSVPLHETNGVTSRLRPNNGRAQLSSQRGTWAITARPNEGLVEISLYWCVK